MAVTYELLAGCGESRIFTWTIDEIRLSIGYGIWCECSIDQYDTSNAQDFNEPPTYLSAIEGFSKLPALSSS